MADRTGERRDCYGPLVWMAEADGWVMLRRPDGIPGAMSVKEWLSLPVMPAEPPVTGNVVPLRPRRRDA